MACVSARTAPLVRLRVTERGPHQFVTAADFADLPSPAVQSALRGLVTSGELVRVRPGLFWRGQATRYGMTHPDSDTVVAFLFAMLA